MPQLEWWVTLGDHHDASMGTIFPKKGCHPSKGVGLLGEISRESRFHSRHYSGICILKCLLAVVIPISNNSSHPKMCSKTVYHSPTLGPSTDRASPSPLHWTSGQVQNGPFHQPYSLKALPPSSQRQVLRWPWSWIGKAQAFFPANRHADSLRMNGSWIKLWVVCALTRGPAKCQTCFWPCLFLVQWSKWLAAGAWHLSPNVTALVRLADRWPALQSACDACTQKCQFNNTRQWGPCGRSALDHESSSLFCPVNALCKVANEGFDFSPLTASGHPRARQVTTTSQQHHHQLRLNPALPLTRMVAKAWNRVTPARPTMEMEQRPPRPVIESNSGKPSRVSKCWHGCDCDGVWLESKGSKGRLAGQFAPPWWPPQLTSWFHPHHREEAAPFAAANTHGQHNNNTHTPTSP